MTTKSPDRPPHGEPRALNSSAPPAIILGGLAAGLGALRAFGRSGRPVLTVPAADGMLTRSRFFHPIYPGAPATEPDAQALDSVLAQSGLESGFLCPCSDHWTAIVADRAAARPDDPFVSAVSAPAVLEQLQNKDAFAQLLAELAVPHPASIGIDTPADIDKIPDAMLERTFLKPRDSQAFMARFERKGWWISSRDEARRAVTTAADAGLGLIAQEYIPGPPTQHVFVDGYASHGRIHAVFARRRLRMFPADFGNSTLLVSIAEAEVAPAVDSLHRIIGHVGYHGIFSAEFKQDPRDGSYRILEINTRPWLFVDFAVRCGVDVCRMAYADALGQPLPPPAPYRLGVRCIAPFKDASALRHTKAGPGAWIGLAAMSATALQPVWAWDDPRPGLATLPGILRRAVGAVTR